MSIQYVDGAETSVSVRQWAMRRLSNLRERLAKGLLSDSVQIGLKRPAPGADEPPPTKLPLSLRALTRADLDEVLPADVSGLSRTEAADIQMRRELADLIPECGIAVVDDRNGHVCFIQWVIGPDRNDAIARMEGLPRLAEGEWMLEGAYVPPASRGRTASLAAAGVALAHAGKLGAKQVITFVGETNTVSMRGVTRLGFRPYMLHVRRHVAFGLFEFDRFRPISPDDPRFAAKS
jgi:RimJ/RimL family protein N-acetyltransferase